MRGRTSQFAIFKPALGRQKDENQYNDAQNVPLPSVSGVIPKKQLFKHIQQINGNPRTSVADLATLTPPGRNEPGHSIPCKMPCKSTA